MVVYKGTIPGAKPILVRAPSKAQASDKILTLEALSGDQLAEELEKGGKIFADGDRIVPDEPQLEIRAEHINIETGMVEAVPPDGSDYQEVRPATLDELIAADPMAESWRVEPKGGLVQRLPKQADPETGWEDIRAATPEEISAAKKK